MAMCLQLNKQIIFWVEFVQENINVFVKSEF